MPSSAEDSVLTIRNLHKRYSRHHVLKGVNFSVEKNAVQGLVGLNGAGKTTTLECVLGLQPFQEGAITIAGVVPKRLHTTRGRVAVVFDTPCLHPQLTVRQALDYARLTCGSAKPKPAAELERLLGIERYRSFKISQLSLGNRRRTAIAQALISQPDFVVLDEPFNGLDAGGVDDVLALIRALNQREHTTFLLASHQLSYLERVCSHMTFLHHGKVVLSQTLDELLARQQAQVLLRSDDNQKVLTLATSMPGVVPASEQPDHAVLLTLEGISSAELNRELVAAGIGVHELVRQNAGVESVFRAVTGDANRVLDPEAESEMEAP